MPQNFVANIGSTSWWAINKAYTGIGGVGVGPLVYKNSTTDSYSQGKQLEDPWAAVQNDFKKKILPQDVNAIYLVLSSR